MAKPHLVLSRLAAQGANRGFIALSTGVMAQRTLLSLRPKIHVKSAIRAENGTDYTYCASERAIGIRRNDSAQPQKAAPGGAATGAIDVERVIPANDGTDHAPCTIIGTAGISDNYPTQALEAAPGGAAINCAVDIQRLIRAGHGTDHLASDTGRAAGLGDNYSAQA